MSVLEKGLPANIDAEKFVLASAMLDPSNYSAAAATLSPDDFSLEKHKRIWSGIGELYERGESVNPLAVSEVLRGRNQLEACDGMTYIAALDDGLPSVFAIDGFVRIVKQKSVLRRAILTCDGTMKRLLMAGPDAVDEIDQAERVLRELTVETGTRRRLQSARTVMEEFDGGISAFLEPHRSAPGVPYPSDWPTVNRFLTGLRPKQLIVLAARTSGGKTAAALQIAQGAALKGHAVAVFSLEMSKESLLQRMVCSQASVDSRRFRSGETNHDERDRIAQAAEWIRRLPLFFDDTAGATVPAVEAATRALMAHENIGLVVIDYLQLMNAPGRHDSRAQEVSKISNGLKQLARELNIPVLALAQFNRDQAKRGGRPQVSDLKESSSIEQAADVLVFLHSEYDPANSSDVIDAEWIIAKQREGPTGKIDFAFDRKHVRFFENTAEAAHYA